MIWLISEDVYFTDFLPKNQRRDSKSVQFMQKIAIGSDWNVVDLRTKMIRFFAFWGLSEGHSWPRYNICWEIKK